jgi:hypothetical protein
LSDTNEDIRHNWFIRWKHTAVGRIFWFVLDALVVFIFASLAIDSGRLLEWAIVILFTIDGAYNLARLIGKIMHGNKGAAA